jgi:aminopeptidase
MSKKELEKNGANDSLVHIDFMFGTDDLNVWGYKNNKKIQIIKNGLFTI